jgi:Protein of unknown function (DUF2934)
MKSTQHLKSDIKSKSITSAESSSTPRRARLIATGAGNAGTQNPEDRYQAIAVAAYYLAEARGFQPGSELDDWLAAEAQIDNQIH